MMQAKNCFGKICYPNIAKYVIFLLSLVLWILSNWNYKINRGSKLFVKLEENEKICGDREIKNEINDWNKKKLQRCGIYNILSIIKNFFIKCQ